MLRTIVVPPIQDTWINEAGFGPSPPEYVKAGFNVFLGEQRVLLRWDTRGVGRVLGARLTGEVLEASSTTGDSILVYRGAIKEESNGWTEDADWTRYDGTNLWAVAGGSWLAQPNNELALPDTGYTGPISWDVSDTLLWGVHGAYFPLQGLLYQGTGFIRFESREGGTPLSLELDVDTSWKNGPLIGGPDLERYIP